MKKYIVGIFSILSIGLGACNVTSNQYQKQVNIPNAEWKSDFIPEFELNIKDTASQYDVYVLLRNDNAYNISNLWLKMYVLPPNEQHYKVYDRIELGLADASGKWIGRNFGDMWETKSLIAANDTTIFSKPGTYKIKFEQIMRTDPLIGVVNVGINVTKN